MDIRSPKLRMGDGQLRSERLLEGQTHFLKTLPQNPQLTGAIALSSLGHQRARMPEIWARGAKDAFDAARRGRWSPPEEGAK